MSLQDLLRDWKIERQTTAIENSEIIEIQNRYDHAFAFWMSIVSEFSMIRSEDYTKWLFTAHDYSGRNKSAFTWDFIERLELDACKDYGNLVEETKSFWNNILPIGMSVGDGYVYYGVTRNGVFVTGREPEFEAINELGNNVESLVRGIQEIA